MNQSLKPAVSRTLMNAAHVVDPAVEALEALPPGTSLYTRDGGRYIRTDRVCICFCNLETGAMCSAKDICYHHGGVNNDYLHH